MKFVKTQDNGQTANTETSSSFLLNLSKALEACIHMRANISTAIPSETIDHGILTLPCAIYRGGTSKGLFLRREDLPDDSTLRDAIVLCLFGSPDPRQIDGLGGADSLTSKLAIVSPSKQKNADVDFTFGQVSLTSAHVDYKGTCGNISSAVGCFAIDQGWVQCEKPSTNVRIWNTNSGRLLQAEIPVIDDRSAITGDCIIAGVPGKGPCVRLDFGNMVGTVTGSLFPTGHPVETVWVEQAGDVPITVVDAGSVCVFILAETVGIPSDISPFTLRQHPNWLNLMEGIRGEIAYRLGLATEPSRAAQESPSVPKLMMVSSPRPYLTSEGQEVGIDEIDLLGRALSNQQPHKAYPVTGALGTATAALVPGTIVNQILHNNTVRSLRIGHPGGVMKVEVSLVKDENEWRLSRAIVERTARELMRGQAFLPWEKILALRDRLLTENSV